MIFVTSSLISFSAEYSVVDSVRPVDELFEGTVDVRQHSRRLQVKGHAALVEQTHDDAFAVDHRDDRHADIDLAAGDLHLDTAVLRQPLLGDVQPGHDLDAAHDRGLEPADLRRQVLFLEQTVDPIADANGVLFVLDVDVRRPLVRRLDQNLIHQLHDRRFLRLLGEFAVVGLDVFEELDFFLISGFLGQGRDGVAADAEVLLDETGDLPRRSQHRHHVQAGERLQFIEGVSVEGVSSGDDQRAVVPRHRHQVLAVNQLLRHHAQHVRRNDRMREIDQFQPELLGQDRQQQFFLDEALIDEHLVGRELGRVLDRLGGLDPGSVGEQPAGNESLKQLHGEPGRGASRGGVYLNSVSDFNSADMRSC
jgi:hypothetical protein